jgi:hypothetical protein
LSNLTAAVKEYKLTENRAILKDSILAEPYDVKNISFYSMRDTGYSLTNYFPPAYYIRV